MAHSFIPHTHGEEIAVHHHEHDQGQGHEHDEGKDNVPKNIFHFFQHNELTGNSFLSVRKLEYNTPGVLLSDAVFLIARYQLPDIEGPPLLYYDKDPCPFLLPKANAYFFMVKAPPAKVSLA
jgi:hypothetical protein